MVDHFANTSDPVTHAPPELDVRERWIDRLVVLSVHQDLDMLSAPLMTGAINVALAKGPAGLIVDLSDVGFLASAGMSVLVAAQEQAGTSTRFGVVADGPATSRPIKLLGIDDYLALYPTLDDALHAMR